MSDPQIRALYRAAPEGFIEARDALARRLRDEGRDDDAITVKKLRRPTVAAWALDQLAEDAPEAIGELLDAGAALAGAQRATLSGRDPQALRDSASARRELVTRLTDGAVAALRDAGRPSDPHVEDIRGTLEAASVDEEVGERLRAGTLDKTVRPAAGFGDLSGLQLVSRRDEESDDEPIPAPSRSRKGSTTDDAARASELEAEIRRLRRDRDGAERKAAAADDARARMAKQVASMEGRLETARAKLRDAESTATELRMLAKRAAKAFETAERKRKGGGR